MSQLRSVVNRAADVQLTAAMHAYIAESESMAGLLPSGERRSVLALNLLKSEPNAWLEAVAHNTLLAIAVMRSDVHTGIKVAPDALAASRASGSAATIRAALANYGILLLLAGDFESSSDYLTRALEALPPQDNNGFGVIETLARLRLAQDRVDECEGLLDNVTQSIRTIEDKTLYVYRHALLTRIDLLIRQDRLADALACADEAISIARHCGDQLLLTLARLARVDILSSLGDPTGAALTLRDVADSIQTAPPSVRGEYHRVLACATLREGRPAEADRHADRAIATFASTGNRLGIDRVHQSLARARTQIAPELAPPPPAPESAATLHAVAETFARATDARREAAELALVLGAANAVAAAAVTDLAEPETWHAADSAPRDSTATVRLDDRIQLTLDAHPDITSAATINAAHAIASAVRDLRAARAAAEQQAALWPAEPDVDAELDAVLVGHMQRQAAMVKRVARTRVPVLVLGDSGTGKEIIARALHAYSERARHPFIAVNCAALPGHLLESTLFGYRRGAFTGADRDNPGLIRAATGGTLFLDEIGELGLDLQPKLLRFLESGEIAPLGDVTTTRVDVRIVCATNRDLPTLVQRGAFREDLFYRIYVVRITLDPLRERRDEIPSLVGHFVAAAAKEFAKGYVPVAEETMERLLLYRWPGNIRQLQNEIRRMVALVEPGGTLEPDMISDEIIDALPLVPPASKRRDALSVPIGEDLPSAVARIESEMIKAALRAHHGRVDAVAKALGISRKGLYLKRQRLGV